MITIFIKLGLLLSDFKSVPQFVKIKDPVEVDDDILAFLIVTKPGKGFVPEVIQSCTF